MSLAQTNKDHQKLSNRLTYVLRYGALKEGLEVFPGGYVCLDDLLKLKRLRYNTKDEILEELKQSTSITGEKKYEIKDQDSNNAMVKIVSGRMMEPSIYHKDTFVFRLVHICSITICKNIKSYDLEYFPDEYLLRRIFTMLKHQKKLTNSVMKSLISSCVDKYDFNGIYITESTIKLICQRCKTLKWLKLKKCGYVVTDNIMKLITKNLANLEELNVAHCTSLTDASLQHLIKEQTPLKLLNISYCNQITFDGIKQFVSSCLTLKTLIVQHFSYFNETLCNELQEIHSSKNKESLNIFYINHDKERRRRYENNDTEEP